jgi:hypothetical protein
MSMAVQEELFPDPEQDGMHPASGVEPSYAAQPAPTPGAPIWLQRLSLFILVIFCIYLGVLVTVLPWWGRIWDHNMFIEARPALASFLRNGAVRGVISGVGLLDIWIGVSEAIHYRDYRE